MQKLSQLDLDDLALGSAVLGSGGGGNPKYKLMMAKQQFKDYGAACLVNPMDLEDEALVAPLAFMGAPLVSTERIPSGRELLTLLEMIEKFKGRPVTHLLAGEIGGSNAFTPLIASSETGVPVVDGDTLGRAFPELQMSSCNLMGISSSPCFIADCKKNRMIVYGETGDDTERFCRKIVVEMGSSAAISLYLMTGKECKLSVISGTVTRAIKIGCSIRLARDSQADPILALIRCTEGFQVASGVISDIDQKIKNGFLMGSFTVNGAEGVTRVYYRNEYLMVYKEGKAIASTPDIIVVLEQESGLPILSDSLVYGLRVSLVVIEGPSIWKTQEGLKFVGPEYFGYSIDEGEI